MVARRKVFKTYSPRQKTPLYLPRNKIFDMTTRKSSLWNRSIALPAVIAAASRTWVTSWAELCARLVATDRYVTWVIRVAFVRTQMSTFQPFTALLCTSACTEHLETRFVVEDEKNHPYHLVLPVEVARA